MLTFVLKKKWFRMISSGEKKEKYCEINPYYTSKFRKIVLENSEDFKEVGKKDLLLGTIRFKNGYGLHASVIYAKCYLTLGTGKEEWGAKEGRTYYILKIKDCWNATYDEIFRKSERNMIIALFLFALYVDISDGCRKIFQYFLKFFKK
jgi:hypothetical protein